MARRCSAWHHPGPRRPDPPRPAFRAAASRPAASRAAWVLDPFCGTGTTGIAALALGRRFTGIDLNPELAAIAAGRLRHASAQPGGNDSGKNGGSQ